MDTKFGGQKKNWGALPPNAPRGYGPGMTSSFRPIERKCYESGKTCKRFRYPNNEVEHMFEKRRQNNFSLFLSYFTRKHDTVSDNANQRTQNMKTILGTIYCSSAMTTVRL